MYRASAGTALSATAAAPKARNAFIIAISFRDADENELVEGQLPHSS
jgi:hypothetical protein